ncbi:EH signature domain-containing protein [Marivita sp.]|uniref:EH signature domain-containing protein n=1 Tax=Marivita sp. TaxID=2003365 RepID=UPI003F7275AB
MTYKDGVLDVQGIEQRVGLADLLNRVRPPVLAQPPSAKGLLAVCRGILDRYELPPRADPHDAEQLLIEMERRIVEWDWKRVPLRFVNEIARLVYGPRFRQRANAEVVRRFLLAEIKVTTRSALLNHLVRVYIECFVENEESIRTLGKALNSARDRIGAQWTPLLQNVPSLFDADKAPEDIASLMEQMEDPWNGLRMIGLRQPHAPGLMDAVHLAFLRRVGPKLDREEEIARVLAWIAPAGGKPRQTGAGPAIDALMAPWQREGAPAVVRNLLIDRLTEVYSHPRVRRHVAWNEVHPDREMLFLRWLMGADIRFLFRVLAEVERGHMWADREEFWWTLLEQERIDEVWIAFNGSGHAAAMAKLPLDARQFGRRFAKQVGERDKSLLIMRIGQKIVVEGTFNFMVHIFDADDPRAPRLYDPEYDVANIRRRRSAGTIVHLGAWQTKVLRALG